VRSYGLVESAASVTCHPALRDRCSAAGLRESRKLAVASQLPTARDLAARLCFRALGAPAIATGLRFRRPLGTGAWVAVGRVGVLAVSPWGGSSPPAAGEFAVAAQRRPWGSPGDDARVVLGRVDAFAATMSVPGVVHRGSSLAPSSRGRLGSSVLAWCPYRSGSTLLVSNCLNSVSALASRSRSGGQRALGAGFRATGHSLSLRSFGRVGSSLSVCSSSRVGSWSRYRW